MPEVTITFPTDDLNSKILGAEAVEDQQREGWFESLLDDVPEESYA